MKKILLLTTACLFSAFSFAQININSQWTWMKGDNTADAAGIYGTKGTPANENKPGAREGSASWTDLSSNLWLYGGRDASGVYNDLWKYNRSTNQWTWVSGNSTRWDAPVYGTQGVEDPANSPGSRFYSVSWRDASGNLWLFGGSSGSGYLNDLWKYNPSSNAWTWMKGDNTTNAGGNYGTQGTAGTANKPGARYSASGWTDASGNLWLFGGRGYLMPGASNVTNANDLWKYNPSTNQWTWVSGDNTGNVGGVYGTQGTAAPENKPGARFGSASWMDAAGNFWLFGGESVTSITIVFSSYSDLWKYNPATNQWTWVNGDNTVNSSGTYGTQGVQDPANKPGGRYSGAAWSDAYGNLWLFGGQALYGAYGSTQKNYSDLWKYTIAANQWTWVKGDNTAGSSGVYGVQNTAAAANKPGARLNAASWADATGTFWLFGGVGNAASGSGNLNDLWRLTETGNGSLPLTLLKISATAAEKNVSVSWQTTRETNVKYFDVEHSADGQSFLKAGSVQATGSPSSIQDYSFLHQQPAAGVNYYRIKMVDRNGAFAYSPVAKAVWAVKTNLAVFPNPVRHIATVRLISEVAANMELSLYDGDGRRVSKRTITVAAGINSFAIDMSAFGKGIYNAVLTWGQESKSVRIVKAE